MVLLLGLVLLLLVVLVLVLLPDACSRLLFRRRPGNLEESVERRRWVEKTAWNDFFL